MTKTTAERMARKMLESRTTESLCEMFESCTTQNMCEIYESSIIESLCEEIKSNASKNLCAMIEANGNLTSAVRYMVKITVDGWIMDELKKRDAEAFERWIDCEDNQLLSYPSRFFLAA